jgi:hypothetical protein
VSSKQQKSPLPVFCVVPSAYCSNAYCLLPIEPITPDVVSAHNHTAQEFERIKSLMGREPTFAELGIFSVMWSEHCSY